MAGLKQDFTFRILDKPTQKLTIINARDNSERDIKKGTENKR